MAHPSQTQLEQWQRELVPEDEVCHCVLPRPPKLRVSWTLKNPACRFVNCARSLTGYKCEYWRAIDPELSPYYKQCMIDLKYNSENGNLHRQIDTLQERVERMKEMMQIVNDERSALQTKEEEVQSALQLKDEEVQSALRSKEDELQCLLMANQAQYEDKIKKLQVKVKKQRYIIWFMVMVGFGIWLQSA